MSRGTEKGGHVNGLLLEEIWLQRDSPKLLSLCLRREEDVQKPGPRLDDASKRKRKKFLSQRGAMAKNKIGGTLLDLGLASR